ncbi:chromosome segregation protein SMC [Thioalkalivibrio halophilus]|uniref:Chromosome partition protein Smc n=1 Tax=Thioalkalivibrio halophilus TaxID=252474 RepID=A0A1V2ZVI5_9GAMM|nr:chromosome segregation protein SMC [Thioalkalivibrio halophilus]OOC09147.1 chromosome segregation protein SMC [Thioalkalivibrio halophilus]
MRLARIKLAGFKSFVDPTTLVLPGNRVGVVGPNGCGKSNTIDAVRWVMGESSAKHLRGDSGEDVIFNGSSSRKPVGQASIELVFDNSEGRLGGEYSAYTEIAVKRALTRDGQSKYYLNGHRARKRDIVDLFLGTGLGPRSYAIIEQGMIARLIEARPEDLRTYLEEAAGISKYKERRRETENRVRHTRENLERLDDLREEVGKQAERLNRQAATAERYQQLAADRRRKRAEAILLRLQAEEAALESRRAELSAAETELARLQAEAQNARTRSETLRQQRVEREAAVSEAQSAYYDRAAEVSRLEQSIRHAEAELERETRELEDLDTRIRTAGEQQDAVAGRIREAERECERLREALENAEREQQRLEAAAEEAEQADQAAREAQQEWERNLAEPRQAAQVARSRMDSAEQTRQRLARRREKLESEKAALPQTHPGEEAERVEGELAGLREALEAEQARSAEARAELERLEAEQAEEQEQAHAVEREHREVAGRLAGLESFGGEADPEATRKRREEWARRHGIDAGRPLVQALEVEDGWDTAVEAVLGSWLEAEVPEGAGDPLGLEAAALADLPEAPLRRLDGTASAEPVPDDSLAARVRGPAAVRRWLAGIYCAADAQAARERARDCGPGESVITPGGTWLGPGWLAHGTLEAEVSGAVARVRLARELEQQRDALQERGRALEASLAGRRERIGEAREARDAVDARIAEQRKQVQEGENRVQRLHDQARQLEQQQARIDRELEEVAEEDERVRTQFDEAEAERNRALERLEGLEADREAVEARVAATREARQQAREQARSARDAAGKARLAEQEARHRLEREQSERERLERQLSEDRERQGRLREGLEGRRAPLEQWKKDLQAAAEARQAAESALTAARGQLDECDHALREVAGELTELEQRVEQQRSTCEEYRLDQRSRATQLEQLREQLQESGFDARELAAELPEDAGVEAWDRAIAELDRAIEKLGPINLAAIDEARELEERQRYLEEQHADLIEALETLEAAMQRIDRETRTLFRETFDKVNAGLGEKFQRLFGGGEARLEMTGDDLLDTGVAIMARPPGKRLSTIHLMSGGEKALTASALVFAIFELNPAPFCMLDEVDAPLDEANVGRFGELLREMSERIQFIFITHNKSTMSMAEQLIGVTMHEPGVSRLVSVDVDEAVEMAGA